MAAEVTFGGAVAVAVLCIRVSRKGREYYARISGTKANIEAALRLRDVAFEGARLNLAIESTQGMRECGEGTETEPLRRTTSITHRFVQIFQLVIMVNAFGAFTAIVMAL